MNHHENTWREALSDLSDSGLSLRRYCQQRHLNYARALYWRRRLTSPSEDQALTFAVVRLSKTEQPQDSGVAVECGKHRIRLSSQFDESVLMRVVTLLSAGEN